MSTDNAGDGLREAVEEHRHMTRPYLIKRNGEIHDRATGERIGVVEFRNGWTGALLGPAYPRNPYARQSVDPRGAGRRWSVADAVWRAHLKEAAGESILGRAAKHAWRAE